jgi:hypothetical protein
VKTLIATAAAAAVATAASGAASAGPHLPYGFYDPSRSVACNVSGPPFSVACIALKGPNIGIRFPGPRDTIEMRTTDLSSLPRSSEVLPRGRVLAWGGSVSALRCRSVRTRTADGITCIWRGDGEISESGFTFTPNGVRSWQVRGAP